MLLTPYTQITQVGILPWMDGLGKVEPLLIETELLHAGLCLGLMKSEKRNKAEKDIIKSKGQK
jgi:hypothetical protein